VSGERSWVALLRGINVGGRHKLAMATLRDVLAAAGASDVGTYIQSGNAVFRHPEADEGALADELAGAIGAAAGFPVPVVLRPAEQWRSLVGALPFPVDDPTRVHVAFLPAALPATAWEAIDAESLAPERFEVAGRDVYLSVTDGMARSALAQAVAKVAVDATVRNWRTVCRLAEMAESR